MSDIKANQFSSIEQMRADFERRSQRSISMPLAGMLVWLFIAVFGFFLESKLAIYVLLFSSGAIFPLALLIAKFRQEDLMSRTNPLSALMGYCVLMVNLLWAVHIPLLFNEPKLLPLSLAIALGLHWVVYSWIVQHPLGIIHAVLRTLMALSAFFLFPENSLSAIALAVVFAYMISLWMMLRREIVWKA